MESYNPKQAREQKVRRDRRRKDNRRQGEAVSNAEPESVSSAPRGQREPSSRVREHKPSPAVESEKSAKDGAAADNAEAPELPDFSNLKRETDEIAALTSKKYSKRQIFSNWTKYENPPEVHSIEEDEGRLADFEDLAHMPASVGGHFKFKSERSWDLNQQLPYAKYFTVNVESLTQGLACIPFYDKVELSRDMLTAEELERIDCFAKQSTVRYNVTKAALKEGTFTDTNNLITKMLNILSYKENQTNRKTDPSMYENVDEDDQLENKSLVQFSFETNQVEQANSSVEVCVPTRTLTSRNSSHNKETDLLAQADNINCATKNLEPSEVPTADSQANLTVTNVSLQQNGLSGDDTKNEHQKTLLTASADKEKIASSSENHVAEAPCSSAENLDEGTVTEEPVILEQRTAKGKKGQAKVKNKKDEKRGRCEQNNNDIKKSPVVELSNVTKVVDEVDVTDAAKPNCGKIVIESVVEVETEKSDVSSSKGLEGPSVVQGNVDKEHSKPVKAVTNKTKVESKNDLCVDDDLNFLLSLKNPVEHSTPKSVPPTQAARSAIEDDELNEGKLPLVVQRVSEENLEDWLDSMLED